MCGAKKLSNLSIHDLFSPYCRLQSQGKVQGKEEDLTQLVQTLELHFLQASTTYQDIHTLSCSMPDTMVQ